MPEKTRMKGLEDKAEVLLVLTRRLLAISFVITAIALFVSSGAFTI